MVNSSASHTLSIMYSFIHSIVIVIQPINYSHAFSPRQSFDSDSFIYQASPCFCQSISDYIISHFTHSFAHIFKQLRLVLTHFFIHVFIHLFIGLSVTLTVRQSVTQLSSELVHQTSREQLLINAFLKFNLNLLIAHKAQTMKYGSVSSLC